MLRRTFASQLLQKEEEMKRTISERVAIEHNNIGMFDGSTVFTSHSIHHTLVYYSVYIYTIISIYEYLFIYTSIYLLIYAL